MKKLFLLIALSFISTQSFCKEPPFWGTIFIDLNIVTPQDPSSFIFLNHCACSS